MLLKYSEIEGFIGRHLLDESGDVLPESSRVPLCLDDGDLERYRLIEICLIFEIGGVFPAGEDKRVYKGKFERTDLRIRLAIIAIEILERVSATGKGEARFGGKNNGRAAGYLIRHDLASACLEGFPICRECPIDDRTRSAENLISPIAIPIEIGDPNGKIGSDRCPIYGNIAFQNELDWLSRCKYRPIPIIFAIPLPRLGKYGPIGSDLVGGSGSICQGSARSLYARVIPGHGEECFVESGIGSIVGDIPIFHSLDIPGKRYDFLKEIDGDYDNDGCDEDPYKEGRSGLVLSHGIIVKW